MHCRGFNSEVKSEAKLEVPKLENSDPLLQRLISTSSISTDALAKRLEDIADDATDVSFRSHLTRTVVVESSLEPVCLHFILRLKRPLEQMQ